MKTYKKSNRPKISDERPEHSVDVVTVQSGGLISAAYFDFDSEKWEGHDDTLVDLNEDGVEFVWFYVPDEILNEAENLKN